MALRARHSLLPLCCDGRNDLTGLCLRPAYDETAVSFRSVLEGLVFRSRLSVRTPPKWLYRAVKQLGFVEPILSCRALAGDARKPDIVT